MEFSLMEIITLLMKRFVLIIACTIAGLGISFAVNRYIVHPTYTASVQMYVNTKDTISPANINELNYAQKVVTTYINFLQTNVFYRQVIEECNLNYSADQLKGMTTIQSVNNTEIFRISVTSLYPKDSYKLVETMQKIAPELIKSIKNTAEISVVDPVVLPRTASGPNIKLNSIVGGIVGLLLSVLFTFLWEVIDVNVKDQEDLLKKYQLPILGAIPNYEIHRRKKIDIRNRIPGIRKSKQYKKLEISQNNNAKFIVTEAYNALRTNLRFILRNDGCKKLLISSPIPEDGKSTTSLNVAILTAQTGARVLLMDCDLRKGRLHSFFNIKSAPGISDILSGMSSEKDIIQNTAYEKLQVLTMGAIPPNPTDLIGSVQMEELLKRLEKNYDYIIIDSPPVNVVSDALSLGKMVDGVMIVVREKVTSHPNIQSAIGKYKFADAKVLGFVINGVTLNQGKNSKSKYYYYHNKNAND
jgi:capsular exopolysaccharide synthesis family protein